MKSALAGATSMRIGLAREVDVRHVVGSRASHWLV